MKLNLKKSECKDKSYVGTYIYGDVKAKLDSLSEDSGLTLSQIVRSALNDLLDAEEQENK